MMLLQMCVIACPTTGDGLSGRSAGNLSNRSVGIKLQTVRISLRASPRVETSWEWRYNGRRALGLTTACAKLLPLPATAACQSAQQVHNTYVFQSWTQPR